MGFDRRVCRSLRILRGLLDADRISTRSIALPCPALVDHVGDRHVLRGGSATIVPDWLARALWTAACAIPSSDQRFDFHDGVRSTCRFMFRNGDAVWFAKAVAERFDAEHSDAERANQEY